MKKLFFYASDYGIEFVLNELKNKRDENCKKQRTKGKQVVQRAPNFFWNEKNHMRNEFPKRKWVFFLKQMLSGFWYFSSGFHSRDCIKRGGLGQGRGRNFEECILDLSFDNTYTNTLWKDTNSLLRR